ncbi:MAG TPA: sporulation protein YqfD [Peptococcaceae bacterium]|nr:MAG: Putative stage IV sporulation YqfD [Moorella sp. 60_41]HBT46684.1 sporulation protein YqfD [Peptococcaceae bacterium]
MWQDWMAFLEGYLIIRVEGEGVENFFNLALERGMAFDDLHQYGEGSVIARIPLRHLRSLRRAARESGCSLRILDKRGIYFWWRRLRRRPMLLLGALVFVAGLYLLSSFVWTVDVEPLNELKKVEPPRIADVAREAGLRPGTLKGNLDLRSLEHYILLKIPELAWAGVSLRGTRAVVEVVEKTLPDREGDSGSPAHIIAAKDAIISEILVLSGQGRVGVGDTVRRGDILISGIVLPSIPPEQPGTGGEEARRQPAPRLVRARGIVRGRVWYEGRGEVSKVQTKEHLTGRRSTAVILRYPNRQVVLKGSAVSPYSHYRREERIIRLPGWRNFALPVELIIMTYYETAVEHLRLTVEEAEEKAREQALAVLRQQLPPRVRVLGTKTVEVTEEGGRVRVKVILEAEEDIGKEARLTGLKPGQDGAP